MKRTIITIFALAITTLGFSQTYTQAMFKVDGTTQTESGTFNIDLHNDKITVTLEIKNKKKIVTGDIVYNTGNEIAVKDKKGKELNIIYNSKEAILTTDRFQIILQSKIVDKTITPSTVFTQVKDINNPAT